MAQCTRASRSLCRAGFVPRNVIALERERAASLIGRVNNERRSGNGNAVRRGFDTEYDPAERSRALVGARCRVIPEFY